MDSFGWSPEEGHHRLGGVFMLLASMPCLLGYNLWNYRR